MLCAIAIRDTVEMEVVCERGEGPSAEGGVGRGDSGTIAAGARRRSASTDGSQRNAPVYVTRRDLTLLDGIGGTERLILGNGDRSHPRTISERSLQRLAQCLLHVLEDELGQIFSGRDQSAVGEFWDVGVDVAMIEAIPHFASQDLIEYPQIDDEARHGVDGTGDGHIAGITVSMIIGPRTSTESGVVLRVAPLGATVTVCGRESDAASERARRHAQEFTRDGVFLARPN